eukprot:CAMPEP_0173381556 /NCGR_PEP_ID=MMETSP1356-20130122/3939_1 /TAXON_ID=77927 ORGANISM="Hemiselmis virescens, Strain PCC157" /NCGR_SAMPLE_ID=MMETSP1356 /ASSEMBLY_ACC=CAM_ASM_000847 /LENGTH=60 /DNA_ID=CAMNT_0014335417 /DNA_START=366 /DNA_END=548 /DNA_ORIENTATION=-
MSTYREIVWTAGSIVKHLYREMMGMSTREKMMMASMWLVSLVGSWVVIWAIFFASPPKVT